MKIDSPNSTECLFLRRWYKRFGCNTPLTPDSLRFDQICQELESLKIGWSIDNLRRMIVAAYINATVEEKKRYTHKTTVADKLEAIASKLELKL